MTVINIQQNFINIIENLKDKNYKLTNIAKSMGYTTTTQLHSVFNGESIISTKAIISLIEQFSVNPNYLFLGKGEMFIADESEIDRLKAENKILIQNHDAAIKTVMELQGIISILEKRNADLIDLSSAAIKYHKGIKEGEGNPEK